MLKKYFSNIYNNYFSHLQITLEFPLQGELLGYWVDKQERWKNKI